MNLNYRSCRTSIPRKRRGKHTHTHTRTHTHTHTHRSPVVPRAPLLLNVARSILLLQGSLPTKASLVISYSSSSLSLTLHAKCSSIGSHITPSLSPVSFYSLKCSKFFSQTPGAFVIQARNYSLSPFSY